MNGRQPIDAYCERTDPGLFAEPLNALSNVAFLLAAALLWRLARQPSRLGTPTAATDLRRLAGLIAGIGLASLAFHLRAEAWAAAADTLAIAVTLLVWIALWLRRVAGWPAARAALGPVLFIIATIALARLVPPARFGGSAGYLAPWLTLLTFAALQHRWKSPGSGQLFAAAAVFTLSLGLRSLDLPLCPHWPLGTHFLWHLCNALTLLLAAWALVLPTPRQRARSSTSSGSSPVRKV